MQQLILESQVRVDLLDKPFAELTSDEWEQIRLSSLLEEQSEATLEYEIDSVIDFGAVTYRVWGGRNGILLLGCFYQNLEGQWIAVLAPHRQKPSEEQVVSIPCGSREDAIATITA